MSTPVEFSLKRILRDYTGQEYDTTLNFLHSRIAKKEISEFAKLFRKSTDGENISLVKVAKFYEAQPHQVEALEYLTSVMYNTPNLVEEFIYKWIGVKNVTPIKNVDASGISEKGRLYQKMIHNGERVPAQGSQEEKNIKTLVAELEKLEKYLGVAIDMTSGYRPEPINTQVGGVWGSEHTKGKAADIYPVNNNKMTDMEFENLVTNYWGRKGGVGLGMATRGFTHVDMGEIRTWNY